MNETAKRIRTRWVVLLSLALSLGLAGAGCGDDEPDETNNGKLVDAGDDTSDAGDTGDAEDAALPEGLYIEGLSAPVKVQFDSSGVLHIDCQTNNDCYAAQGYFHADNRFFEMDLVRRQTRGELSEVIGTLGLDSDKQFRHLMTTSDGTPLEEAYVAQVSDESRAMLEAYARGVNAWLYDMRNERNGAKLTREYDFPLVASDSIRDWEPEDTIALYLLLAYQLGETATDDLFRGEMAAQLDPAVAADLFSVKPGLESNIIQASGAGASTMLRTDSSGQMDQKLSPEMMRAAKQRLHPALSAMQQARKRFDDNPSLLFGPRNGEDGSNNWVVGPSRTANGNTLLADDPHLSLNNPAIWYYVELDSKTNGQGDLHVAGASVPAVPGIVVGHNDQVAWGVTTARLDLADAYIEELTDDGTAVIFNGQEVPLVQKEFSFTTSGGVTSTETFEWVPHHGPLISKDVENNRGVSMRWTLQEGGSDIDFLQGLQVATTVEEAMDAMGPVRSINQNWVFTDRAGTIAWYPKGAIPNRPFATAEVPNWLPLPGDGSAEWDGYLSEEDNPRLVDPPEGFIATANNDMDGSYTDGDSTNDGHSPWQSPPAYGHRHKRIVERIQEGGNDHTVDTMHDIQADTYVLHGEVLVPHILQVAGDNADALSADAQGVVDALTDWRYTCPTGLDGTDPVAAGKASDAFEASESIGCSAFHVMLPYLTDAVFADEIGDAYETLSNWLSFQAALIYVFDSPEDLNNGEAYFDDISTDASAETKADIVLAALETTAQKLASEKLFGSSTLDDWRWGRIHTVSFVSLFSRAGIDSFDNGPFANDGGFFTVDVANPTGRAGDFDDSFNHPNGPSLRLVFEASDSGIDAWFQLPGGQDHHEDSEFYGSLIDKWLSNTPTELLYDRDAVDAAAVETLEVQPAP